MMFETFRKLLDLLTPAERRRGYLLMVLIVLEGLVQMVGIASILPLLAVLALAVSVAWEVAAGPVPACTSAEPCGSDWTGLAVAVVLVLSLYWVWRQPRLAIGGLAFTVLALAVEDGVTAFARPSALAYLLATGFAVTGLVHRLAVAGRHRRDQQANDDAERGDKW